jgi:transducin (beta)-like 1
MAVSSSEINLLVYRYLQEAGFTHSAFTFGYESLVHRTTVASADLPPGSLISILQKGLQYIEIEAHLNEDGSERTIPEAFALLAPQAIREHRFASLQNEKLLKRQEQMAKDADESLKGKIVGPSKVSILKGHTSEVFICSWNPKVDVLASGSKDSTARLWQIPFGSCGPQAGLVAGKTTKILHHIGDDDGGKDHKDVTTLDWNRAGTMLATGTFDGQARIWTSDGILKSTLTQHKGPIFSLKWNDSGKYLLSGSVDKTAIVWDTNTGEVKQQFKFHKFPTLDVDWKNETCFATCSSDRLIHVCELGLDKPKATFVGHDDEVNAIKWDPSKRILASCSDDGTAKLWKMSASATENGDASLNANHTNTAQPPRNNLVHSFDDHAKEVYTIQWSPCGEGSNNPNKQLYLASASFDSDIMLWDVESMKRVHWLRKHTNPVYSVSFSPDGNYLASGAFDKCLHVWSVKDGELVKTYRGPGGIFDVCWSASGDKIAAGFSDNSVAVIDLKMM